MVFAESMSWADADASCQLVGAHLVSIESAAENTFVAGLVSDVATHAWTGLTDQWSEGTFVWYEGPGEALAPVHDGWAAGQPDGDPSDNADCGLMDGSAATWADQECSETHPYVCEHDWDE